MAVVALSAIPLQQVDAKRMFGGSYDLSITMVKYDGDIGLNPRFLFLDQSDSDPIYVTPDNFDILIDDVDKLPALVNNTILPQIKELFVRHQDKLEGDYVEYIHVEYSMKHNIMDVLIIAGPDYPGCYTESCGHKIINVEPPDEGKMSLVNYLSIDIAIYSNLESHEYQESLNMIQALTIRKTEILANQGQETLSSHRNELLSNVVGGKGSLADTVPIDGIGMRSLGDIARVSVFYPEDELGLPVIAVDETKTGIDTASIPEFPANLIVITAIGLIGVLIAVRLKGSILAQKMPHSNT